MKELLMIPVLLAALAFGYYLMTRVDRFMEENWRSIDREYGSIREKIRIAAENPGLLASVASVLDGCADGNPFLACYLSCGSRKLLLDKLEKEEVELLLLKDEPERVPDGEFASLKLPAPEGIWAVWKKSRRSRERDLVLFALENDGFILPGIKGKDRRL